MSFLSRLEILLDFFKDLFFDEKEEASITSSKFNARKFTLFLLFISLASFNAFLLNRVFYLVNKVQEQKEILSSCHPYINKPAPAAPDLPFKLF